MIEGTDSNGEWSGQKNLVIRIVPKFFYETWFFIIMVAMLVISGVALSINFLHPQCQAKGETETRRTENCSLFADRWIRILSLIPSIQLTTSFRITTSYLLQVYCRFLAPNQVYFLPIWDITSFHLKTKLVQLRITWELNTCGSVTNLIIV